MKIDVNVSGIDLDTLVNEPSEYVAPVTVADKVAEQLVREAMKADSWKPLVQRVREIRDEEIRKLVLPAITEAFEKPIQKTNAYGEPIGQPATLREVVVHEARKILNGTKGDAYGRNAPLAQDLINQMVTRELRAELADAIKAEREKVVAAVRAQAADLITEAVTKGVTGR
jgi:hypothetical protein